MSKILGEDRSVERADSLNIQSCCHFQKSLYLCSIFTNDTDKISSRFVIPVFFYIQRTEFTKSICGKQNLISTVIGYHNFRPMYHGCGNEGQVMPAG